MLMQMPSIRIRDDAAMRWGRALPRGHTAAHALWRQGFLPMHWAMMDDQNVMGQVLSATTFDQAARAQISPA